MLYRRLAVIPSIGMLISGLIAVPQVSAQNHSYTRNRVRADFSKSGIESPVERLISPSQDLLNSGSSVPESVTPVAKYPARVLNYSSLNRSDNAEIWNSAMTGFSRRKRSSSSAPVSPEVLQRATGGDTRAGVKVAPGKVAWQPDFRTACLRASASGKPVLLFQMMGKLDDEFC